MKLLVIPRQESHTPANLDPPEVILERALDLAMPDTPVRRRPLKSTTYRSFTRRGTMFVGKKCNLRCHFCCYLDRVEDRTHPEHEFMPLEKAKAICKTLVEVFGRNAVDIQGGEPTIYPHILPLIEYCNEIGLRPTLITNAMVLDRMERVLEFKKAGVYDFLVSVQGLGAVYDTVVGMEGAHVRQLRGIRNIAEAGVPFRFNTVMTKAVVLHLPQIATLGVKTGAEVVNYLMYSPQDDQVTAGTRTAKNVPRYSEVRDRLVEALDILAEAGVEANVRFFPYCLVPERHRPSLYNYAQIQYDHHDWDFASTAWTDDVPQRTTLGDVVPPDLCVAPAERLRPRLRLGRLRALRKWLPPSSRLDGALAGLERGLVAAARRLRVRPALEVSDADEKAKAMEYGAAAREVSYVYAPQCQGCDAKAICDGLHSDSAAMFGTDEVQPIQLGFKATDPTFYIGRQAKVIEPEDESWGLRAPCPLTMEPDAPPDASPRPPRGPRAQAVGALRRPGGNGKSVALSTTVIIPTYRRLPSLLRTLASLQEQTLPDFEVFVVDNAADPETERAVAEVNRTARHPVRYLAHSAGGVMEARHRAIREARGDLLVFTDDDATFAPGWLAAHVRVHLDYPEMAAAAGPVELAWEVPPPKWLLSYIHADDGDPCPWRHTILSLMDRPMIPLEDPKSVLYSAKVAFYSVNMSIRREVMFAVGGFNPEAFGDVWLGDGEAGLNRKLWDRGCIVGYVPDALVYHHIPPGRMTVEYLCRRWANEGACNAYADFHPDVPSRLRLAKYAATVSIKGLRGWAAAWWCRGRTDRRSLDIQLEAARTRSWVKYVTRMIVRKWARELVAKRDWLNEP